MGKTESSRRKSICFRLISDSMTSLSWKTQVPTTTTVRVSSISLLYPDFGRYIVWQNSRNHFFSALVRLDNIFPFSCSGWPARHLHKDFPFSVSQTRSSPRVFYPPTQLDTKRRVSAGSLAFPSGVELFEKSYCGSAGHLQLCTFTNCTVFFSSSSLAF